MEPEQFQLRIAGLTLQVNRQLDGPQFMLPMPTARFEVEPTSPPDAVFDVAWADLPCEATGRPVFDSGGVWRLHEQGDELVFSLRASTFGEQPYQLSRCAPNFRHGTVLLHRGCHNAAQPLYPLAYPLDELLMVHLFSRGYAVEVHAAGVVDAKGIGQLFLGASGAGKSTTAKLWEKEPGVRLLSDDRIVLREQEGAIWMHGTPWHGEAGLASPDLAPLGNLFFLQQARENRLAPLGGATAAAQLLACAFFPFHERSGIDFTISLCQRITRRVPCHELSFVPDRSVIERLRSEGVVA